MDYCLTCALAAFYFYYRRQDQIHQANLKKLEEEKVNSMKALVGAGLGDILRKSSASRRGVEGEEDADMKQQNEFKKQQTLKKIAENEEKELAEKEEKRENTVSLGGDTYAMAFKAQHFLTISELDLKPDEI